MKTPLKIVAGLLALAVVAWIGASLYWHIRIMGAVSALKTQYAPTVIDRTSDPLKGEAFETLTAAGCRSLPYLIDALDSSNNPELMWDAFFRILGASLPPSDPDVKAQLLLLEENRLYLSDSSEKRREKVGRIQTWWKENGPRCHQSWRVWSSKCCSK